MSVFGRLSDSPTSFLLAGARVIDPTSGTDAVRDVAVSDGLIADPTQLPGDAERIDARGLVVAPGFCDLHTHLREPGGEWAETVESGTRAAAHGGFTTVCAMPNTDPPLDRQAQVDLVQSLGATSSARVRVIAAATRDRAGQETSDYASLAAAGVVGVSDDGAAIPSAELARFALARLAELGILLVEHAEDAAVAAGALMRAGPSATRLGLHGWSPRAEVEVIERDVELAAATGARVHITHVSTAAGLEAVRSAKARGLPVTCDVTPHHLALADDWVAGERRFAWDEPNHGALDPSRAYDGSTRVNPPLASRVDAAALLGGVADGSVDAIATDHAPHPPERKLVPFADAAPGMIGLETALSLGLAAVEARKLALGTLIAALSGGPARVIGERRGLDIGQAADLVVFDPASRWRVEPNVLASKSKNTPLLGMELPGVVRLTVANGRVTHRSVP